MTNYNHGSALSEPSQGHQDTRAQLEQQLQLLFRSVASARNGIIITDCRQPDQPIIYANQAFEELTGYTQDEIIGRNCRFLQGDNTNPETRDQLRHAVMHGESLSVEIKNYRKDGSPFWNDLLISPIYNDDGVLTHFVGNQLDVTERKNAVEALRLERNLLAQRVEERTALLNESRNYLASVVETLREPLLILDEQLCVISANRAFYTTFQVNAADTNGTSIYELGNGQWNIPQLRALLGNLLPNQQPFEGIEVEHDFPDIGRRTMLLNARQVELEGSKQQRILLAIEDISDRKSAEASSLRDAALTQAVLSSLSAHIAVIDQDGTIIAVNEAWRRFALQGATDPQENAFLGGNYLDVLRNAPDEGDEAKASLRGIERVLAGKVASFSLEYPCDTATEHLWFLLQVTPLQYANGGAVVAHIDITDRKQLEQRKDDFISMASHELKTPITSLKLFMQLLRRQVARAGVESVLPQFDKMNAQVDRLARLVQELLDVSRIYAGKLTMKFAPFDLHLLLENVIETFQATVPDYPILLDGSVSQMVSGDSDRIEQVVLNLLSNAVKYSPKETPISVSLEERKDAVVVSVKDRGIGIDPQHHAKVFDRFYQVTDPTEKTYPGLGMGLYISKQIIQQHKGDLWIESEKGEGSVFRFTLPMEH